MSPNSRFFMNVKFASCLCTSKHCFEKQVEESLKAFCTFHSRFAYHVFYWDVFRPPLWAPLQFPQRRVGVLHSPDCLPQPSSHNRPFAIAWVHGDNFVHLCLLQEELLKLRHHYYQALQQVKSTMCSQLGILNTQQITTISWCEWRELYIIATPLSKEDETERDWHSFRFR